MENQWCQTGSHQQTSFPRRASEWSSKTICEGAEKRSTEKLKPHWWFVGMWYHGVEREILPGTNGYPFQLLRCARGIFVQSRQSSTGLELCSPVPKRPLRSEEHT